MDCCTLHEQDTGYERSTESVGPDPIERNIEDEKDVSQAWFF